MIIKIEKKNSEIGKLSPTPHSRYVGGSSRKYVSGEHQHSGTWDKLYLVPKLIDIKSNHLSRKLQFDKDHDYEFDLNLNSL